MFRNTKTKAPRFNSGQSTVEYIVLVGAVIAALLLFFNGPTSQFSQKINSTYNQLTSDIDSKAGDLTNRQDGLKPSTNGTPVITVNAMDTNSAFNTF